MLTLNPTPLPSPQSSAGPVDGKKVPSDPAAEISQNEWTNQTKDERGLQLTLIAVNREVEDGWVRVGQVLRAVAVMHVPIDDQYPLRE